MLDFGWKVPIYLEAKPKVVISFYLVKSKLILVTMLLTYRYLTWMCFDDNCTKQTVYMQPKLHKITKKFKIFNKKMFKN